MNRDFNFSNGYYNYYPTNQPPPPREEFHLHSPQAKKQLESELIIFNGEQPIKDMYSLQQNSSKPNLAFVPKKINKSPSQKSFPIIYNTYNDGGDVQPHIKLQNLGTNFISKPIRSPQNNFQQANQNSQSSINYKQQKLVQFRPQQVSHTNEFHTFQQIPPESQPHTAKFIQPPEKTISQHYFMSSQTEPYRPPSQIHFQQRQMPSSPHPVYTFQSPQPMPIIIPHNKHESRSVNKPNIPIPAPNRVAIQQQPPRFITNHVQEKQRIISVPQDQYERYVEHMSQCRRMQEQSILARTKIQQLSQKQQFYWEENMTLRQQNKRLRDLVTHFQKRQKQLLREREQAGQNFQLQIAKYRDSTLEQFRLLLERYKLQMQKKK